MIPTRRVIGLVALSAALASCDLFTGPDRSPPPPLTALPRALTVAERQVVAGNNAFAFGLLREVCARDTARNTFISPLSASMALGMTMNGAAGATLDGMRAALGFGQTPLADIDASYQSLIELLRGLDSSVDFRLANSIWARQGFPFRQSFYDVAQRYFDAEVKELDFSSSTAAPTINAWVKQATGGRIESIVSASIPPEIVMYLINAIYFKGSWRDRFDAGSTGVADFTRDDGGRYPVHMMRRTGFVPYFETPVARGVELPYGRTAFVMDVVLPANGTTLRELAAGLDTATWRAWLAAAETTRVVLGVPRFELSWEARLNEPLKALGMDRAFYLETADFSAMSPTPLFISEVKQKTWVRVNEEGTEAAAATSVGMAPTALPRTVEFTVDRPFLVAIRERFSGTILFLGAMGAPESS